MVFHSFDLELALADVLHYNLGGISIDNSVTIVKSHGSDFFIYSSNITHGVWEFGGIKDVKFSYSNPGCERKDVSVTHFDDHLGEVCWNAASWMENNWANKYSLELSNSDRYGSPYVGCYLIAETNGFGHNYEGSPVLHDCFEG
ncbi:hypothetical protein BBO_08524 [Beauveria brongniartii RCEF 3172]|uniref:Uncharacterized protein n=1 Tax=Beauveria brongniartii RCEF 3172 TaxID=1081107 RepID=A0A166XJ54_9HYPO|nr:hypothetical protein BBO_08524 [Beauveria brongniartii RCEF 3172]